MAPCQHLNFEGAVGVARLADDDKPLRFMAEIRIRCTECGQPFMFGGGLPAGFRFDGPSVDVSGQELSIPIKPWDGSIASRLTYQLHRPEAPL